MVMLELDTTNPEGSLAIARDGVLLADKVGDSANTHGQRLPGEVTNLLMIHGLSLRSVDVFVVCSGPGSFTGLRVGLATIQAFALAHGRSIVPVPALEALAYLAITASERPETDFIGSIMDAHRGEVFAALYAPPSDEKNKSNIQGCARLFPTLNPLVSAAVGQLEPVLVDWQAALGGRSVYLVGRGTAEAAMSLEAKMGSRPCVLADPPPLAPIMTRIGAARAMAGKAIKPHAVRPIYVRRSDAELARERRPRR